MKKMISLVLIVVLAFSVSVFAASTKKAKVVAPVVAPVVAVAPAVAPTVAPATGVIYDNMIVTNVWPWLAMIYNIGYERMIGSSISIRPRGSWVGVSGYGVNFFGIGVDLFWHPLQKGIEGWYFGPRYDAWIASSTGYTGMMHFMGLMAGYNIVVANGFTTQMGLGVQINLANSVSAGSSTATITTLPGTLPCFDAAIGYAF